MQSKNKNDSVQFSDRYANYMLSKRYIRGLGGRAIFPIGGADKENNVADVRADKKNNGSGGGKPNGVNSERRTSFAEDIRHDEKPVNKSGVANTLRAQAGGAARGNGILE